MYQYIIKSPMAYKEHELLQNYTPYVASHKIVLIYHLFIILLPINR